MTQLIVLGLIGNLPQQGYDVTLEISEEGQQPYVREVGKLPPQPDLAAQVDHHWRDKYRNLVAPYRRVKWSVDPDAPTSQTGMNPRIEPEKIFYDGSVNSRIEECQESARELENVFLQWLDAPELRTIDRCLHTHLNVGEVSRCLIRSEDIYLQRLPWHKWQVFKAFGIEPLFSVSRLQPVPKVLSLEPKSSVRILAVLGHSSGINVAEDEKLLRKLAPGTIFLVEPSRKQINDQLWAQPWDIIFFAGHSETEGDTGKIYINPREYLTTDDLWHGLRKAVENGLQVAIFNSCDGLGLAQKLINDFQIPHLIVMRELVPDRVAQEFLKYFLAAFEGGRPFHLAAREAREQLQGMEGDFPCASWLPTVYENPLEASLYWDSLTVPEAETTVPNGEPETRQPERVTAPIFSWLTWRQVKRITAMSLLVTCLVMGVRWFGFLETPELLAFDLLMRMRPEESLDENILIVEATPADKNLYGYPLTDKQLTEVLQKINASQPLAVGLNMHRGIPQKSTDCQEEMTCEAEREEFIKQIRRNEDFISVCSSLDNLEAAYYPPSQFSEAKIKAQFGFSNSLLDKDNSVRRQLISYNPDFLPYATPCITPYSFSFQLAYRFLTSLNEEKIYQLFKSRDTNSLNIEVFTQRLKSIENIEVTEEEEWRFGKKTISRLAKNPGGYKTVNGRSNQIIINYRATRKSPATTVSIRELLDQNFPSSSIKDRIVIVGTANHDVDPFLHTPQGDMPVIWINAHIVSHLINFALGKRTLIWFMPKILEDLTIFVSGILFGIVALARNSKLYVLKCFFMTSVSIFLSCYLILVLLGGWMPLVPLTLMACIMNLRNFLSYLLREV